jgi:protein-S-isoprenylcysteine O-methyltransferase Ste14
MDRAFLEIIFLSGMILQVILHVYYFQFYNTEKVRNYFNKKERIFLIYIFVGFLLLPVIYIFSTWFSFFDYSLPKWLGFFSAVFYCFSVWLFFRAYADLGHYWSPGPEIKEDHILITTGVFKWVRHPMYASFAAIAAAQILMLQNWIVGPAFLVLAIPFYLYRVQREEQQLIRYFGDEYRAYMNQTNALFPKKEQIDFPAMIKKTKILLKIKG